LIPHVELLLVGEHDLLHALVLVVAPLHFDQQLLVGRPEQLIPRGQVGQLLEQECGLAPPLLKRSLSVFHTWHTHDPTQSTHTTAHGEHNVSHDLGDHVNGRHLGVV
jgi:hypothetical protein